MKWYQRLRWAFLGMVAEMACDYDDTVGAVAMPLVSAGMALICWYAVLQGALTGTLVSYGIVALATPIATLMTILAGFASAASVVYATQTTELPAGQEVVTRE